MKMVAPANVSHFDFQGHEYHRDKNGHFNIDSPDHVAAAQMCGAVEYDPKVEDPFAPPPTERVDGDFDQQLAEKEARIAELEAKLAETTEGRDEALQALADAGARADATDVADDADDAPGDTSEDAGGASEDAGGASEDSTADKVGAYLAEHPDFTGEDLDRDGKVEWLKSVGVVISVSSSKVAAQTAIAETIADYKAGLTAKDD